MTLDRSRSVILTESFPFISFRGMGVQDPQSSWGTLVAKVPTNLEIAPGRLRSRLVLPITLLALNFVSTSSRPNCATLSPEGPVTERMAAVPRGHDSARPLARLKGRLGGERRPARHRSR